MADASRFDAVMAEAAQGDALASSSPLASSPNLLVSLREAQSQHGLRHGDFTRYRCAALHTHTLRGVLHMHMHSHTPRPCCALTGSTVRTGCTACTGPWASPTRAPRAGSSPGC